MTTAELPPALRPWSRSLSFLTVEAALHIGPLVRRLDALVRRHDATNAPRGEPDGYGGLTNRGDPERLLLSEWLLAEELPLEFVRRAANRELLHVEPAFRAAQPEGSVAVFCDCGPDQLGAARLVQLAALIVLHRRALARGSELRLGLAGDPPTRWHAGELPELFSVWRRAPEAFSPGRAEYEARVAAAEAEDELWVLAGDALARAAPEHKLLLHCAESAFDERGVTAVDVRFEGRTSTLPVPPGPISVQTLRGLLLRRGGAAESRAGAATLGCPSFSSTDRRLLLRGERLDELVVTPVPTNRAGGAPRPRVHRFNAPVLAASSFGGKRLVALVVDRGRVRCETIGKPLGALEHVEFAVEDVGLEDDVLDFGRLPPVYYDRGDLLFDAGSGWWLANADDVPRQDERIVAVAPSRTLDQPQLVTLGKGRLYNRGGAERLDEDFYDHRVRVAAAGGQVAWSGGGPWRLTRGDAIEVPDDEAVLGLLSAPSLVTVSRSGLIVRVRGADGVRTLTAASGPALARALHPLLGLLAVQRDPASVDVLDVDGGATVMTVRAR